MPAKAYVNAAFADIGAPSGNIRGKLSLKKARPERFRRLLRRIKAAAARETVPHRSMNLSSLAAASGR